MLGRITLIAVFALVGIHVALSTSAQEESTEPAVRPPTLGERLQRFKRELAGEDDARPRPGVLPRATRKIVPQPAPSGALPLAPAVETEKVEVGPPPRADAATGTAITFPPRMETQGARPARGGGPRLAAPVDPATQSLRANMAPIRRPAEAAQTEPGDDLDGGKPLHEASQLEPTPHQPDEPQLDTPNETPADAPHEADALDGRSDRGSHEGGDEPGAADSIHETLTPEPLESSAGDETQLPGASGASDVLFTAQSPVLSVEAKGPRSVLVGKEAEFAVTMRNAGAAANNVVVTINVPQNADVSSAEATAGTARPASGGSRPDTLEWTIDRLEADSRETLSLKLVPRQSSPLDLAVNWTFTPETSQTMVEVREPKLAMNLSGPTDVLFGQTKIYKLSISNPGSGDTENVTVGLLPIGRSGQASGNHRLGTLKAGESKTIDIELTARQAGAITIKAHAFADGGLRAEAAEQVLVRRASLQVEVEAPRVKYAGTAGTFRVKVANTGDAAADNVHVSALLPPEAKYISATSGGRSEPQEGRVEWIVGSLEPGGQRVFELQTALHAAGDNRMQFTAAADGDLSAAATSNTRVEAIADLKLEVRDPQGPIAVGDEAVYEVRVHNRGTKAAEGIDLAVFFSEGLEPISADGGPHDIGSGQVVFQSIATLAADDTAVFRIRARAETAGNHVFRAEVNCESLDTKLASEEATHFYGERRRMAVRDGEPHPAVPGEETPAPTDAGDEEPTPAEPEAESGQ
jgi:uncharacterized repeat protein (TIGR01451 family)